MHLMFWKSSGQEHGNGSNKKRNYHYSQNDVLGTGGSSTVYKATWNGQDSVKPSHIEPQPTTQLVALKIVPRTMIRHREAYLNVLRRQADMSHANCLCLLDWFESTNKYYIAFELAAGGDLFDRLADHPYTEDQGRRVMTQMLEAVQYCHSMGMVHRDIKPENWLFRHPNAAEGPLLADFGVAVVLDSPEEGERLFEVCGTPGYAAPEVYQRTGYTRKCDVFSCGVVGYALLTAWSPWLSEDAAGLIRESAEEKITFQGSNWLHISDQAKDFISLLMKPNPEVRPSVTQALAHPWLAMPSSKTGVSTPNSAPRDIPQPRTTTTTTASTSVGSASNAGQSRSLTRKMPTMSHHRPEEPLVRTLTAQGVDGLDGVA